MNGGNLAEANAIANNIVENDQKILSHGKRADAIVKGMLMHSRTSAGLKEPTSINDLADEYLRSGISRFKSQGQILQCYHENGF